MNERAHEMIAPVQTSTMERAMRVIALLLAATPGWFLGAWIPNRPAAAFVAVAWGVIVTSLVHVLGRTDASRAARVRAHTPRAMPASRTPHDESMSPHSTPKPLAGEGAAYAPPAIDALLGELPEEEELPEVSARAFGAERLATSQLDTSAILSSEPEPAPPEAALPEDPPAPVEVDERPEMATEKFDVDQLFEVESGSVLLPMDEVVFADTKDELEVVTAPSPQPEIVARERHAALATRPIKAPHGGGGDEPAQRATLAAPVSPTTPIDMQRFSRELAREAELAKEDAEETVSMDTPGGPQRSTQQIQDMPALLSSMLEAQSEADSDEVEYEDEDATSRLSNVSQLMSQLERELDTSFGATQHPTQQLDWNDHGGLPE